MSMYLSVCAVFGRCVARKAPQSGYNTVGFKLAAFKLHVYCLFTSFLSLTHSGVGVHVYACKCVCCVRYMRCAQGAAVRLRYGRFQARSLQAPCVLFIYVSSLSDPLRCCGVHVCVYVCVLCSIYRG